MIFRFPVYLLLILFLSACSGPGYYVQAISGHWKLMHARQDIPSLLDNPETGPGLSQQLKTADEIKSFAEDKLDLPANGNYSSYVEVGGSAVVWNVVATGEFSLLAKKWCFPVAGCVPYRGFFKKEKAESSATRLRKKNMDVHVSPATAYSSLGWFKDPLLSTMLGGSDIRLAAYLFHELAHLRLYIKDDTDFNEGYASFVEQAGVRAWLDSRRQQDRLVQYQQLQNAKQDFTSLIRKVRGELTWLYQSTDSEIEKREKKAGILKEFKHSHEQLISKKWNGKRYYSAWLESPVNNARLALYNAYAGSQCAFLELFKQAKGNMSKFHQLAEQKSRLEKAEREKWLTQTCTNVNSVNSI
jgi:predicted aminopeptidase